MPKLSRVILIDGNDADDWVMPLAQLEAKGAELLAKDPRVVEEIVAGIEGKHLATLIYTSGTTGKPKGVRLLHECWAYCADAIDACRLWGADDVQYLWLPMSHSFGKVLMAGHIASGSVTAVDGRIPKLVDNLAVVRPPNMAAEARIVERVYTPRVALAPHRRYRRGRSARRSAEHRSQEGPDQDERRQVHRAAALRGQAQGDLSLHQPGHRARRQAKLRDRARHGRRGIDHEVGAREVHQQDLQPGRRAARRQGAARAVLRRGQQVARQVRDREAIRGAAEGPDGRRRRADAVAQGQAQGRREEVRGDARQDVRRRDCR